MDDNIVDRLREVIKQQAVSMANMRREFEETEKALVDARNTLAFKKMTIEHAVEVIRAEYNKMVEETAKLKDRLEAHRVVGIIDELTEERAARKHVLTPVTPTTYKEACDAFVRACDRGVHWKDYFGAVYHTRLSQAFQQIQQAYNQACLLEGGGQRVDETKADQQV